MKASIIINNYNYKDYIVCCVKSALNQTYSNTEIIIIDDGSTDHSLEIIQQNYQNNHKVKIISKEHNGQLSCFNEAKKYTTGDLIFFLDADDFYKETYVEEVIKVYKNNNKINFLFCAHENRFINRSNEIFRLFKKDHEIGSSFYSTLIAKEWIGNVTSTISLKSNLFHQLFPIPFIEDWRIRADDCLVYGASILGAEKYYFDRNLVNYRIHKSNHHYGKKYSKEYLDKREKSIQQLFSFLLSKTQFQQKNTDHILLEFKNRKPKNFKLLKTYIRVILIVDKSTLVRAKNIFRLVITFIISRF